MALPCARCPDPCLPDHPACRARPRSHSRPSGLLAHLIQLRSGHAHVIGLDRQDAGCRLHELLFFRIGAPPPHSRSRRHPRTACRQARSSCHWRRDRTPRPAALAAAANRPRNRSPAGSPLRPASCDRTGRAPARSPPAPRRTRGWPALERHLVAPLNRAGIGAGSAASMPLPVVARR